MKKNKVSSMNFQQIFGIWDSGMGITIKDIKIHMIRKQKNSQVVMAQDQSIEISDTVTYES